MDDRGLYAPVTGRRGTAIRATALAAHLLAAVALGVYADLGFDASGGWEEVPLMATPWLVLAFGAARTCRPWWLTVLAGLATVVIGLVAYYAWLVLKESVDPDTIMRHYRAPLWLCAGAVVGAGFGVVAVLSRARWPLARVMAWGVVIAIPVVDLIRMVVRDEGRAAVVAVALCVVTVGLWLWARRTAAVAPMSLLVGVVVMTLVLWQGQILVLRHAFSKNV